MAVRQIRAGAAYIELLVEDKLNVGLKRAQRKLNNFASGLTSLGGRISAISAGIFAPIGILAVKSAADAEEALSRFAAVFGRLAPEAARAADEIAAAVGRSSVQVKDALATFQAFFVGLGFGADEAAKFSRQLVELGLDFASFNNLSDAEAFQRFISALSGSGEVLDRFGINIKQAALEIELLNLGLADSVQNATEQQKAIARLAIISKSLGAQGAIGDAVRTAQSFTNQLKRLGAVILDTSIAVGNSLIPFLRPLLIWLNQVGASVRDWAKANPGLVFSIFAVGGAVGALGVALLSLGLGVKLIAFALGGIASLLSLVGAAAGALLSPIGLLVTAIAGVGVALATLTQTGRQLLGQFAGLFVELFDRVKATVRGIANALAAGDIPLAAELLFSGLRVLWLEGTTFLVQRWLWLRGQLLTIWARVWNGVQMIATAALFTIAEAWIDISTRIQRGFVRTGRFLQSVFAQAASFIQKRLVEIWAAFDDSIDANAVKAQIQNNLEARLQQIEDEAAKAIGALNESRRNRLDRLNENEIALIQQLADELAQAEKDLAEATGEKIEDAQRKLDDARKRFNDALGRADELPDATGEAVDKFRDAIDTFGARFGRSGQITTRGTFDPGAIQALQAGSEDAAQKTAQATQATAVNTKQIADQQQQSQLRFG